ncbi:hypothetical protein B484DRAFT_84916 [Ochromonadaceae sp. CCMP2298]|nr:hypothetical protein B484DRAFT_84916 [Ochromonadaceae sp. CCMP2298]|mmetsp:Transcript_6114/g.13344  ORF Transcript_6114/g.13344 Transcript_6114/m.13344 type:complete len:194 (+) Transcript_6114:25-606(+)
MSVVAILRHAVKSREESLEACDGVKVITEHIGRNGSTVEVKKVSIDSRYDTPWVLNDQYKECMRCDVSFGVFHFKHHCRGCGWLVCHGCAKTRTTIAALPEPNGSRTCKTCLSGGDLPRSSNDVLQTRYPFSFSRQSVQLAFAVEVLDKEEFDEILLKGSVGDSSPATTVEGEWDQTDAADVCADLQADMGSE